MSSEVLGGGVMVGAAAVLWVAYLMPTWTRRRQYLTIERNAVRLQQTMRILAETSEIPAPVRLEANARAVVTQQKLLAQAEDDARAEARAVTEAANRARRAASASRAAANREAASRTAATRATDNRAAANRPASARAATVGTLRRIRRVRAFTTVVLLGAVVAVVLGAPVVVGGGSAVLLAAGAGSGIAALGALSRLARTARHAKAAAIPARALASASEPEAERFSGQDFEPVHLEATPVAQPTWTPRPLPRPLHLAPGTVAQAAMASADAAAELRRAAAVAEVARRAEQLQVAVTPLRRTGVAAAGAVASAAAGVNRPEVAASPGSAAASRFAAMGIVGETAPGMLDLDAVLRRRRAVG